MLTLHQWTHSIVSLHTENQSLLAWDCRISREERKFASQALLRKTAAKLPLHSQSIPSGSQTCRASLHGTRDLSTHGAFTAPALACLSTRSLQSRGDLHHCLSALHCRGRPCDCAWPGSTGAGCRHGVPLIHCLHFSGLHGSPAWDPVVPGIPTAHTETQKDP